MKRERRKPSELDALYLKTKALVEQGSSVVDALKETGLNANAYQLRRKREAKTQKPVRKYTRRNLIIQDLPEVKSDAGQLFAVYGSPKMLAEFMRHAQ